MYWSVVTITTVGYGDLRPITTEGKALSMVISLGGVLMFALPAGILGSGFVEVMQVHLDEEHEATVRPCPYSSSSSSSSSCPCPPNFRLRRASGGRKHSFSTS